MELPEDELVQKYVAHCELRKQNTLLPFEYEFTCNSCGYNVTKRKNELSKSPGKK